MSASKYITLSSSIPSLLDHIESLLDESDKKYCQYSEIRYAIKKGYKKLKIYYSKTDDLYVYTVATSK